jgi:hypothetical protein
VKTHRKRLRQRGIARFEVQARVGDKGLLRELAKRLAEGGEGSNRLRQLITASVHEAGDEEGAIWRALRRSPLVGVDLDLRRDRVEPRELEL